METWKKKFPKEEVSVSTSRNTVTAKAGKWDRGYFVLGRPVSFEKRHLPEFRKLWKSQGFLCYK